MNCLNCSKELNRDQKKFCSKDCYFTYLSNNRYRWKIDINGELHQILEGLLLSDGGLEINRTAQYPILTVSQSRDHLEYLQFLANKLNLSCDRITHYNHFNKKTQKVYYSCRLKTLSSPIWTDYYKRWYPNGKKVIPNDFQVTPISLLHTYLGDGCLSKYSCHDNRYVYNRVQLYLESFSKENLSNIILPQIKGIIESSKVTRHIQNNKDYYQIRIDSKNGINQFFRYIGKSPVCCYNYKFNTLSNINCV